ncbi:hypothetical protein HAX54_002341 [Datura stramonium]|uniref:Uncharacterized protein n=1 Tax=Datura stramonium TaxID=4076 RepID=A0ABS8WR71_DATST|nr:hypothetical protein [Datura stramonium]
MEEGGVICSLASQSVELRRGTSQRAHQEAVAMSRAPGAVAMYEDAYQVSGEVCCSFAGYVMADNCRADGLGGDRMVSEEGSWPSLYKPGRTGVALPMSPGGVAKPRDCPGEEGRAREGERRAPYGAAERAGTPPL